MRREFLFEELPTADLIIDAVYHWGPQPNIAAEPISKLLPGSQNSRGIRISGRSPDYRFGVIYSDFSDPNWPDAIDLETGGVTYFGDNKRPGHDLHSTIGNRFLKTLFDHLHRGKRQNICPVFAFTTGETRREVVFRGLVVPGRTETSETEDLTAIWRTSQDGSRFQNYRAFFTILNVGTVSRAWINDLQDGNPLSENCPDIWRRWIQAGRYTPLLSPRTIEHRTREEQLPSSPLNEAIVQTIIDYFTDDPYGFEKCAVSIANMHLDGNIVEYTLTPRSGDGGRDAVGKIRLGKASSSVLLNFLLEAKCYSLHNGVGVNQTKRLLSRMRYRNVGIFVTTSFLIERAYRELKEDEHPVIVISAEDIANTLKAHGYATVEEVNLWLLRYFPRDER